MFAKNLVTAPFLGDFSYATQVKVCKKFGNFTPFLGVFSYATQVTVSKKFGDCLLHFREFFSHVTQVKFAKKLVTFCSIFGRVFSLQILVLNRSNHILLKKSEFDK